MVVVVVVGTILLGATSLAARLTVAVSLTAVATISFVDDLRSVRVLIRLIVQGASALALTALVIWTPRVVPNVWQASALSGVLMLWFVGYTNVFNFMDGINGIAGFQILITSLGAYAVGHSLGAPPSSPPLRLLIISAGASAGFLPFNFPRARVFMGDVGSATIGLALAFLVVWLSSVLGWSSFILLGTLHANFIMDSSITMYLRWRRGEPLHIAHRDHFYQRAVRGNVSHAQVTTAEAAILCVITVGAVIVARSGPSIMAMSLYSLSVSVVWLSFFAWCERRFQLKTKIECA